MNLRKERETFRITDKESSGNQYQVINEYRINERLVEFRSLDGNGSSYYSQNDGWRVLDREEIHLHFALGTSVARWLDKSGYNVH